MKRVIILFCILCLANVSLANPPKNIKHTNITATQFSISWLTDEVGTCAIKYGTNPSNLNKIGYDERGEGNVDDIHHITITGLTNNTTYYYDIISNGITYNNSGQHYTIATGPQWIPSNVDNYAYGTVTKSGISVQNSSCIVYLRLQQNGTTNISAEKSMLVDSEGIWLTYLNQFAKLDLSGEFKYTANSDYSLIVFAQGGGLGVGSMIVDIKDPPLHQPTPALEIGTDTSPPYIYDPQPASHTIQNVNTNVTLHLRDTGYGVASNTLIMKVNGGIVTPSITGTPQNYYLFYDPPQPFEFGEEVTVNIYAKDLAPTPNILNTTYTFTTTSDIIPATITSRSPNKNAAQVPVNTNIVIYLQDAESGLATATLIMMIEGERVYPQISGTKFCIITYNPPQDFKWGLEVNVEIEIKDNASNILRDAYTFTTTVDKEKPETSGHTPSKNALDAPIDTPILFSITDKDAGVDISTIVFKVNDATITTYSLNENQGVYSLYYDPPVDFRYGEIVKVGFQVEDLAFVPNKLVENYTFTTTKDTIPPKVIYRQPDIKETQVPVNTNITIYLRDDEMGINKDSIVMLVNGENVQANLVITGTGTEYVVNYDPPVNFGYNQVVSVSISANDLANNPMQDMFTFTTILDSVPPYLTDYYPAKGTTGVKIDTGIMFHLKDNESGINKDTFVMFVEGIDVTSQGTFFGTKSDYNVFYQPKTPFDYGQEVNILIKITDFGSNTIEGTYSFTTEGDTIKPKFSDHNPAKGAIEVNKNTNIGLIIKDDESGIDTATIIMKVNGAPVAVMMTPVTPPKAYLITYNPPVDFGYNEVVKIYIEAKDKANNIATETYTFTTVSDKEKPYTTEQHPSPGAVDVQIDTNIVLSIGDNESGVVRESILLKVNNATITTMTVFPIVNGWTLLYNPSKNFNYGERVAVYIEARDKAGNLGTQTYTFTTVKDTTPPYPSDYAPLPFATAVPINTDIVLHLRDDGIGVDNGSIFMYVNDKRVFPILIPPLQNYTLIYRPPVPFNFNELVNVRVDARDLAGNTMTTVLYTFTTTVDNVAPYLTDCIPYQGATQVAVDTNISLHLKDNGAGVNKDSIIMKVNGEKITPIISGTKEDYTIFYNPTYNLGENRRIYVSIYAQDLAATPNTLETEYFFTTIDTLPPYTTDHIPAPNSKDARIDTNITFQIKDNGVGVAVPTIKVLINNATITDNYEITGTIGNLTFTYNPPLNFEYNQTVWVTVYAEDLVGNKLQEVYNFFIADTIPPYTQDHKPEPGTTGVPPDTEIEFRIKDIGVGVNKDSIELKLNGNKVEGLNILGTQFDYIVRYKPPHAFEFGKVVTVTIEAKDLAFNSMPAKSYTWTTKLDQIPPTLLWVTSKDTTHLKVFFEDENPPLKNIDKQNFFINESMNPTKRLEIYSASLDLDAPKNVNLFTEVLKKDVFYTLVVNNVTDAAMNPIRSPNNRCEFSLKDNSVQSIIEKGDKTKVNILPNTFFEDIPIIEINNISETATITQAANNNALQDKEIRNLIPNTTRVFIARKFNGSETLPSEFRTKPKITIPYPSFSIDQEEKVFYRIYQLVDNRWVLVPGRQEVDVVNNTVSVQVECFGYYRIAASTPAPPLPPDKVISQIEVFPNPFKPNHSFIYFRNFVGPITIQIFNIAGELIRTLDVPSSPYGWDVKDDEGRNLATGVYIYVITNSAKNKVTGKVSVIR